MIRLHRISGWSAVAVMLLAAPALAVDLTVTNVEVTQAVQTPGNTIQLVAARSTAVRATLGVSGSGVAVSNVTGRLHVFVGGSEVTPVAGVAPINAPFTAPLAPQRANENDTLNFELPAPTAITASPNVSFRVDVTPIPGESNTANNSGSANGLTCVNRTAPLIFYTKINYTPAGLGLPSDALIQSGVGDAFVKGILPVNDAEPTLYRPGLFPSLTYNEDENGDGVLDALGNDGNHLLSFLASCRQLIVTSGFGGASVGAQDRVFLWAWLAGNPIDGNGLAQVGGRNAFGNTELSRYQRSFAHELTHNFGFNHISDNLDQVGWDVLGRLVGNPAGNAVPGRVKPLTLFDVQVAGLLTPQAWVETSKYNTLLASPTLASPSLGAQQETGELSRNVLVVQGIFDPAGTKLLQLKPVFRYPWLSEPTQVPRQNQDSPFLVLVRDAAGGLTTVPFTPLVADDPDKRREQELGGAFEVMIPLNVQVSSLQIVDRKQTLLGAFERTRSVPKLQITSPRRGAKLKKRAKVVFKATDRDTPKSKLMFQAAYSPDNGKTFVPIAVDLKKTSFSFPATQVQASRKKGLIRIFASDGLNTTFKDVRGLTVPGIVR